MDRSIELKGNDDGVKLILDSKEVATFNRDKAINARVLYQALDYQPGDKYAIGECAMGPIPEGAFSLLKSLIEEIVEGINNISASTKQAGELKTDSSESCDEDIPF